MAPILWKTFPYSGVHNFYNYGKEFGGFTIAISIYWIEEELHSKRLLSLKSNKLKSLQDVEEYKTWFEHKILLRFYPFKNVKSMRS